MADGATVVGAFFAAVGARDLGKARTYWHDDAVWHITGTHELAGDYGPDDYLAVLGRWFDDHPGYSAEVTDFRAHGPQGVAVHLRTHGGSAPGTASGLMIYRLRNGRIAEGWAVPTFEDGRFPF